MKIQRAPRGLQDLLQLRNFGKNPSELADGVMPTIDLAPFYGVELFEIDTDTQPLTGPGDGSETIIPAGEIWYCKEISLSVKDFQPTTSFATRFFIDLNVGSESTDKNALEYPGFEYWTNAATGPNPGQAWDVAFRRYVLDVVLPSGTKIAHKAIYFDSYNNVTLSQRLLVYKLKG